MDKSKIIKEEIYSGFFSKKINEIKKLKQKSITLINRELIIFYFKFGFEIVKKQKDFKWGDEFLKKLSNDFKKNNIKGFSSSNLKNIRKFYLEFSEDKIGQQLAVQIPFNHIILIIEKIKSKKERHFYIKKTIENSYSRNILKIQIDNNLYKNTSKSLISNFREKIQNYSLADKIIKENYILDFLEIGEDVKERELEKNLLNKIKNLLLELGEDFSFISNQYKLSFNKKDYFVDLLFFNRTLNCLIAIELKIGEFKPEYTGKDEFLFKLIK